MAMKRPMSASAPAPISIHIEASNSGIAISFPSSSTDKAGL
jgi:hypothetical protein